MYQKMKKDKLSQIDAWSQENREKCDPAVNSLLATHFETQKEFDEAFLQMDLALRKDAQNKNLYERMVWMAYQAKRLNRARELIESALLQHPGDYKIWRSSGLAHLLQGKYPQAIKSLQKSLNSKMDNRITHFLLGYCLLALLENDEDSLDSQSDLLRSTQDEFRKAGEMAYLKRDPDFEEGTNLLNEKSLSGSLQKMGLVLGKIKELQAEPASFSYLALSVLMGQTEIDRNEVEYTIHELKKRSEQNKEYPVIHNHLGLCFLILWRSLFFEAQYQLKLAVEKDAEFQRAKTNLMFLESSEKKISAWIKELRF